jgi:hypothetical protein
MKEAEFTQYADQELQKCIRYKRIWKRATNPRIKDNNTMGRLFRKGLVRR